MINQILTSLVFLSTLGLSNCSQKNADYELTTVHEIKSTTEVDLSNYSKATFAAGCFWCEEAIFESIKGVEEDDQQPLPPLSTKKKGPSKKPPKSKRRLQQKLKKL